MKPTQRDLREGLLPKTVETRSTDSRAFLFLFFFSFFLQLELCVFTEKMSFFNREDVDVVSASRSQLHCRGNPARGCFENNTVFMATSDLTSSRTAELREYC